MVFNPNTGGKLVVDRYDFQKHLDGTGFRQGAGTIDTAPGIQGATDLQTSLNNIAAFMVNVGDQTLSIVDVSAGGSITLNSTQANHQRIKLIGVIPNNTTVIVPPGTAVGWVKAIWNATTGAHTVTIAATGIDTGVIIPQSAVSWVYSDGTNAQIFSSPISLSDIPPGTNGQVLTTVSGVAAWATPGASSPGGSNTQIQFNNANTLDGAPNATYVGGFLSLSTALQLLNSGFSIQLAAPTLSGSTVLTLPDITDTLVGRATTDTLTNKTINANGNFISDASIVLGDLLKSNGSTFQRFGIGSSLQVLRTNTGATDLEWATIGSNAFNTQTFNTTNTWIAPGGVTMVVLIAWGGGGGGGGGATASTTANKWYPGGGGGGGAQSTVIVVPVTPAVTYQAVIGAGGSGQGPTLDSGNGGDTIFKVNAGSTLATFKGGSGVTGLQVGSSSGNCFTLGTTADVYAFGGGQVGTGLKPSFAVLVNNTAANSGYETGPPLIGAGVGGHGRTTRSASIAGYSGAASKEGYDGGVGGVAGNDASSSRKGGGGGGGGGGGPLGVGGNGGTGGNASGVAGGGSGGTGSSAAGNTGAGGGGGGGGGNGAAISGGTGGTGGDGGSGQLTILWWA